MSNDCPICGYPEDGGPGAACTEAERERVRQRLRALEHVTVSDGTGSEHTDVTGRPEDRVLSYIFQNPGKYPEDIADALGMGHHEVSLMTAVMAERGLVAPCTGS